MIGPIQFLLLVFSGVLAMCKRCAAVAVSYMVNHDILAITFLAIFFPSAVKMRARFSCRSQRKRDIHENKECIIIGTSRRRNGYPYGMFGDEFGY